MIMSIKSLQIGLLGLFLCVASAWAATSSIQGVVKDANGQPVKGAEIRVEPRNGGKVLATTKTDASGRYTAANLPVGIYRVTLIVNGQVKSSINNTQTGTNKPVDLNFKLQPASASSEKSVKSKKGKRMVWVPPPTGSHMGGRWVEVEDGAAAAGASNVQSTTGEDLQKQIHSSNARGEESSVFGR
jgi:5-hydroxyisourate hydrolase-like protein (transthyretin family)